MRKGRAVKGVVVALALSAVLSAHAQDEAAGPAAGLVILKEAFRWDVSVEMSSLEEGEVKVTATVRPALLEEPSARALIEKYGIDLPASWAELWRGFSAGGREVHVERLTREDAPVRKFRIVVKVKPGQWPRAVEAPWIKVAMEPAPRAVAGGKPTAYVLKVTPFAGAVLPNEDYDALAADPVAASLLKDWKCRVRVEAAGRVEGARRYGAHEVTFEAPVVTKVDARERRLEIVPDFPYTHQILTGILYVLGLGALFALAVVALKKMARD